MGAAREVAVRHYVIAGGVSHLLMGIADYGHRIFNGTYQLTTRSAWFLMLLVPALGGMGLLVGYIFPRVENLIPAPNGFVRGTVWFMVVWWVFVLISTSRRGVSTLVFSTVLALVAGSFFIWFAYWLDSRK